MGNQSITIPGFAGVNYAHDPFIVGKQSPEASSLSLNFRAEDEIRTARGAYGTQCNFDIGSVGNRIGRPVYPGCHFPYGSKCVVPLNKVNYNGTFYCAGTGVAANDEFTIEFQYRHEYTVGVHTICEIPGGFTATQAPSSHGYPGHMFLMFDAYTPNLNTGYYRPIMTYMTENGGTLYYVHCVGANITIPADGDWHHFAITRGTGGSESSLDRLEWYIDGVYQGYIASGNAAGAYSLPDDSDFKAGYTASALYDNCMYVGLDDGDLAEFRVWDDERTSTEIAANDTAKLDGDETNLVCLVPFDQDNGKDVNELASNYPSASVCRFSPCAPYVEIQGDNTQDNYGNHEVKFTGHNCYMRPSQRALWKKPVDDGTHPISESSQYYNRNENGAVDGGIFLDRQLGLNSTPSYNRNRIYLGVGQIRLRLHQLKEGTIAGRLGLVFDTSSDKYRIYFLDEFNEPSGTVPKAYVSYAVVDETWINDEKTITVIWDGRDTTKAKDEICRIFVDQTEESFDDSASPITWAGGTAIGGASGTNAVLASVDTTLTGTSTELMEDTAIGGNYTNNKCMMFDLVFFRQWWFKPAYFGTDAPSSSRADFLSKTYNVNVLGEEFRILKKGLTGYLEFSTTSLRVDEADEFCEKMTSHKCFASLSVHANEEEGDMSNNKWDGTNNGSFIGIGAPANSGHAIDTGLMIKRCSAFSGATSPPTVTLSDIIYDQGVAWAGLKYIGGITFSNMVNCIDADTLKEKTYERPVYQKTVAIVAADSLGMHEVIEDDSVLQGHEKIGASLLPSRYFILHASGDRAQSYTGMRSLIPRWCDGPFRRNSDLPPIRGIYRFISEDGKVNKFLVISSNVIYEFNTSTGEFTPIDQGWVENESDSLFKFTVINNTLIMMSDESARKMNFEGDISRLGIERPPFVVGYAGYSGDTNFQAGEQYTYSAQYYDSKNASYSGVTPIYGDHNSHVNIQTGEQATQLNVYFPSCMDKNVDECILYRTGNLQDAGSIEVQYRVNWSKLGKGGDRFNRHSDIWHENEIANLVKLSANWASVDLVPNICNGMGSGRSRLMLFGSEDSKSSLYWSDVDALGLARPDMFPPLNQVIVEEGGTTAGTAVVEFLENIYAFKEDGIFRIDEGSPGNFTARSAYKGVGAVSQLCVVGVRDSLVFLDKNGLYTYKSGEPLLLSESAADYIRDNVNLDKIDKSFILYNKKDGLILCFVPSSDSSYCDRCLVYDTRRKKFTIDTVPDVTCGFVDDDDVYLGTPYGNILKYDRSSYTDCARTAKTSTGGTISSGNLVKSNFFIVAIGESKLRYIGNPVIVVQADDTVAGGVKAWMGIIDEIVSDNECSVKYWEPMFNTTATTPTYGAGGLDIFLGYIPLYNKSPRYTFLSDEFQKNLKGVALVMNEPSSSHDILMKFNTESGRVEKTDIQSWSTDYVKFHNFSGMHRNIQTELFVPTNESTRLIEFVYNAAWAMGQKGYA